MANPRVKSAKTGIRADALPIVEYDYGETSSTPHGQNVDFDNNDSTESAAFGYDEVRFQVSVDCYYTIGAAPDASQTDDGKTDILFAGIPYHEVVDPEHLISVQAVNADESGKLFIRPLVRE